MSLPGVTVVIPTRDRADMLALTLRSMLDQQEIEMEVVVVDDGDGDGAETAILDVTGRNVRAANAVLATAACRRHGWTGWRSATTTTCGRRAS